MWIVCFFGFRFSMALLLMLSPEVTLVAHPFCCLLVFAGLSSPACLRRPVFVSCFPFLSGDRFSTVFRVPELSRDDLQRVSEQLPSVRAERGMWITAECEISRSQKTDGQSAKRRLRKKQLRSKKTGRDKGAQ